MKEIKGFNSIQASMKVKKMLKVQSVHNHNLSIFLLHCVVTGKLIRGISCRPR